MIETQGGDNGVKILSRYLLIVLAIFLPTEGSPQNAIPDAPLNSLVEIRRIGSSGLTTAGSGFFLLSRDSLYLVTARHVLFDVNKSTLVSRSVQIYTTSFDLRDSVQGILQMDVEALSRIGALRQSAHDDIVIVSSALFPIWLYSG